jgi:hypothetical protein
LKKKSGTLLSCRVKVSHIVGDITLEELVTDITEKVGILKRNSQKIKLDKQM